MKYKPNEIPLFSRVLNKIMALLLLVYGGYGVYINHLALPTTRGGLLYLSNESAWIMYAAFICGSLVLLSEVIDHYDRRDNEHKYQIFAKYFKYIGWALFIGALLLWLYQNT